MESPLELFSKRAGLYAFFIRLFAYGRGLRAFFRRLNHLRDGIRVLDAGCGTGVLTLSLRDALQGRGLSASALHAFDLTPAMMDRFRSELVRRSIQDVQIQRADVLQLDQLPADWVGYDLIISASMLEYLPPEKLPVALVGLRMRLAPPGAFVLFITRNNWLMRLLIGRLWVSRVYSREELLSAFSTAGFGSVQFRSFPLTHFWLNWWGWIVEARARSSDTSR